MQPGFVRYREAREHDKGRPQPDKPGELEFEQIVWRLAGGDVSKRDEILWRVEARIAYKWLQYEREKKIDELQWELMKMEFLARLLGSKWRAPRLAADRGPQTVGGYCKGISLEECRKVFGEKLPEICATCPE